MVQKQQALIDDAFHAVRAELSSATRRHGSFHSMHEGLGVIYEEFDELADEIRNNDFELAIEEAKQVAAMGIRFMLDIGALIEAKENAP